LQLQQQQLLFCAVDLSWFFNWALCTVFEKSLKRSVATSKNSETTNIKSHEKAQQIRAENFFLI
jgi:hypothetical protein